ncbi:hypothetical protein BT63DRAFT_450223 [Microthyrium microscopicum]|uniref:Uncharacterized protein n=1 Tax=Microthyrium microscopicum TaxID=703497 RepID=A0A6A6UVZ0_9PEZI|nr:hypothetical protein BT63DRAFT_450223 [Microthyrium microscopicum]
MSVNRGPHQVDPVRGTSPSGIDDAPHNITDPSIRMLSSSSGYYSGRGPKCLETESQMSTSLYDTVLREVPNYASFDTHSKVHKLQTGTAAHGVTRQLALAVCHGSACFFAHVHHKHEQLTEVILHCQLKRMEKLQVQAPKHLRNGHWIKYTPKVVGAVCQIQRQQAGHLAGNFLEHLQTCDWAEF